MFDILKELCSIDGTSSDEENVRDFIIKSIDGFCDYSVDALSNIIAFKKGKKHSQKKLLVDAHTDEVGLIITAVTPDGFLKFKCVGSIDTSVLLAKRVKINGKIFGVIGLKPIHLAKGDEEHKLPSFDSLYIDIGAKNRNDALETVMPGDRAVVCSSYTEQEDKILSKALDDRIGCAILITLLREESEYDFYASFSSAEEVGVRGATVSAFSVSPEAAIVLEGTTAADIAGVPNEKRVCALGKGTAVSFMDKGTVYDRNLYNKALSSGISCQTKCAVSGGNNSSAVHLSGKGVKTIALSVPCRYIHSESSVADKKDITATYELAKYMINCICGGEAE